MVKSLNAYIDTWGKEPEDIQNKQYDILIREIRVDLGVDERLDDEFPSLGLRTVTTNKKN